MKPDAHNSFTAAQVWVCRRLEWGSPDPVVSCHSYTGDSDYCSRDLNYHVL